MTNLKPFADAGTSALDTFSGVAGQAMQSIEKLTELNMQVLKTSMAEAAESTQTALSLQSPQEIFALQTALFQAAPQKLMAYGKQVKAIFDEATAQQRADAQAQVSEVQARFVEAVGGVLKNAPGSENTLALVKSAVAAANNAYEGVTKASKQVGDAVDANIVKFTDTATKTAKAARAA